MQMPASSVSPGFSIVPEVFGVDEVNRLVRELETCPIRRSRAGARHLLSVPQIAALSRDRRLVELAEGVLGCPPVPFGATLFDKSAEANWLVVWHQDTALPLVEERDVPGWGPWSKKAGVTYAHAPAHALANVVALRLHLDDSTLENGPLRVLPRTHTLACSATLRSGSSRSALSQSLAPWIAVESWSCGRFWCTHHRSRWVRGRVECFTLGTQPRNCWAMACSCVPVSRR